MLKVASLSAVTVDYPWIAVVILLAVFLNVTLARILSYRGDVWGQSVPRNFAEKDGITYVFLGLAGEMRYLKPFYDKMPGDIVYVHCGNYDYDFEKMSRGAYWIVQSDLKDSKIPERELTIRLIGVSIGARVATEVAWMLQENQRDYDLKLLLINPCIGVQHTAVADCPVLMKQLISDLATLVSYGLGMLSFVKLPNGHTLAGLQGELATAMLPVRDFPSELRQCTQVVVSKNDEIVKPVESRKYFETAGVATKVIDAGHVDLEKSESRYFQVLEELGWLK